MNESTHRFAWDGVSFLVPADWNLSSYRFQKGLAQVEMEDDVRLRLQIEWTRPQSRVNLETVRTRYRKHSSRLAEAAEATEPIEGLPDGWTAFLYDMPDSQKLLIAFCLASGGELFCFLRIHVAADTHESPRKTVQRIASSFQLHDKGPVPWAFYDVAFEVDAAFRLSDTALQAGRKLTIFEWRMRRLIIWHFSLASVILGKGVPLAVWGAEVLNEAKTIRGPTFLAHRDGSIAIKRTLRYPFGHYDEIGRRCFRYKIGYRHLPNKNQLVLWAYNYRKESDLEMLPAEFGAQKA